MQRRCRLNEAVRYKTELASLFVGCSIFTPRPTPTFIITKIKTRVPRVHILFYEIVKKLLFVGQLGKLRFYGFCLT